MNVNVELYEFLMDNDTGIYYSSNEGLVTFVHVPFCELKKFQDIIGYHWFEEGTMPVFMAADSIVVDLDSIIASLDHDLESYKNCFPESDWENALRQSNRG